MSNLTAIQEALYVYRNRDNYDRQGLLDSAVSLLEWGIFSKRHIAAITGVRWPTISGLLEKADKTGGRFDPIALPFVEAFMIEPDPTHLASAAKYCSPGLLARFTGVPEWKVRRTIAQKAAA